MKSFETMPSITLPSVANQPGKKLMDLASTVAKIPKSRTSEFMSEGHIHNHARRYAEKKLIIDLWIEWKKCHALGFSSVNGAMTPS